QSHRVWHNVTLPVDDPWWGTHYPPCGWRCRCRAVPMRSKEFEQRGDLQRSPPAEPEVPWTNPRTGEVRMIPARIDPGFGYNVGEAAARWQGLLEAAREKVAGYAAAIGAQLADDIAPLVERDLALADRMLRTGGEQHGACIGAAAVGDHAGGHESRRGFRQEIELPAQHLVLGFERERGG
ncbi:MAG: hypothetical protein ACK4ST_17150, partial [Elioraea tepidiphila]